MRNFWIWGAVFLAITIFSNLLNIGSYDKVKLSFSDFLNQVDSQQISSAYIQGEKIVGDYKDGRKYSTIIVASYPKLVDDLRASEVNIEVKSGSSLMGILLTIFISWFPILLLIGVWVYFAKSVGKSGGGAGGFSFAKSKAKLFMEKDIKIRFSDVAGIEEAREELIEIVDFLGNPDKFVKLGGRIPKGCLLLGNPGTGKTLLARAIAGEAGVPFFSMSGSDFVEMFVGVGASRVRDLFEQAKKNAPAIIFIDEIDAVGRHRGSGVGGGNDEREQTLNQLLVEMDGFEDKQNVVVIAATNRADVLDRALLRPGRFDRRIAVPNPDIKGREAILKVHMEKVPYATDVEIGVIARGTPGFTGAELANVVNEAALYAAKHNKKMVTMDDFEYAKDKVLMGVERKSMAMSEEEKKLTAYHEAGHALVGMHMPASDPIHKATIVPRGNALGMVMRLPTDDRYSVTRRKLIADLMVAMAGRVSEEMIFGYDYVTTGASSDISYATDVAKSMVSKWGLNDKVGLVKHEISNDNFISNDRANLIDKEVKNLIKTSYEGAKKILTEHKKQLHLLAKALIEHETLSGSEISKVIKGEVLEKNKINAKEDKKEQKIQGSFTTSEKKTDGNIVSKKIEDDGKIEGNNIKRIDDKENKKESKKTKKNVKKKDKEDKEAKKDE